MSNNNSIALLPLDNRPVSYLLPKQIADFSGIDLILPERNKLGDLNRGVDLAYIDNWCRDVACNVSTWIIALDTWIYGGLVQSRKHDFTIGELKKRVDAFVGEDNYPRFQSVYGFSSIMRIPNYNSSEEEKDYWENYGEKIFKWSELMYKVGRGVKTEGISNEALIEAWYQSSKEIPPEILADYKAHRDKNLTVNNLWLESLHKNLFKYLVFSSDDSAKYGMNVVEAEFLTKEIEKHHFEKIARVISGTDEISLLLLTNSIVETCHGMSLPTVHIYFNDEKGKNERGIYESSSISSIVKNHIGLLDLKENKIENADIVICVHVASGLQGDHVFKTIPANTKENAKKLVKYIENINKPFILIDLAYANGSDPNLINELLKSKINWNNCYGYAGWNTAANSTGSALAMGICRWIAEKKNTFKENEFKKALLVRFLDDYAYQAKIRYKDIKESEINEKMTEYEEQFSRFLGIGNVNVQCKLPWKRSFEVEINII